MAKPLALSDLIPLWRTLREEGVTALVTPAMDYIAALELGGVDVRFASEEAAEAVGEELRRFVSSLDEACALQFIYRVYDSAPATVDAFAALATKAKEQVLRDNVSARADWFGERPLRRVRIFLFVALPPAGGKLGAGTSPMDRGSLGNRCRFKDPSALTQELHTKRLKALATLRDRIVGRLSQCQVQSRELDVAEVQALHYELLNPSRARKGYSAPDVMLRDNLWEPASATQSSAVDLLELTEAEQLVFEDIEEHRGHFVHGGVFRRVATLKILPESGTACGGASPLLALASDGKHGTKGPFPYTLVTTVRIQPQAGSRFRLRSQHQMVSALKNALPFLNSSNIEQDKVDAAKQSSIEGLFDELTQMSSTLAELSVSVLLEADTLDALEERTEAARTAFNAIGNSEMLVEDLAQLPTFLAMLPGSAHYQVRKKTCTSRNAADFLPVYSPWAGCSQTTSLLTTTTGDAFSFDPFDKKLSTAHHGLVVADTGSGKSVGLGFLIMDALANGVDAILIDNGGSWRELTELLGGTYIPVDLKTSLSPFVSYDEVLDSKGVIDLDKILDVVNFLQVCITDRTLPSFDKLQIDTVSRAVRQCYEKEFKHRPQARPVIGDFQRALAAYKGARVEDQQIATELARRLEPFCGDGAFAAMLDAPSKIRFGGRLLTFDLQNVSKDPTTKAIAMATVITAVTNRAMARTNRVIVALDEAHETLGKDDVGERFFEGCYRKLRKYDVAMWSVTQALMDYVSSKAGPAIIANSPLKIFLRHGSNRDLVIDTFKLPPRAADAFNSLQFEPGYFSDLFLMYGPRMATLRLALHPLAYWILTTDKEDRDLLARFAAKNPGLERVRLLQELARRYPHGAARGRHAAAA
jgi:hypothetical protein